MNINVANANLNINKMDSFKLTMMANAVLNNKSTYSYFPADVAGQAVEVFTRRDGSQTHANRMEKLFIVGGDVDIRLDSNNKNELEHILSTIQSHV